MENKGESSSQIAEPESKTLDLSCIEKTLIVLSKELLMMTFASLKPIDG
jgi:hypothetical protein